MICTFRFTIENHFIILEKNKLIKKASPNSGYSLIKNTIVK